MTRGPAIAALWVVGCYAAPPLPVDPSMLPACSAGSYGVLGTDSCAGDDECASCVSPEGTERAVARARLAALGDACASTLEPRAVACCEHRCTLVARGAVF